MSEEITYIQAIGFGLAEEMARDESVFLIGEDIATYGGAFKATKGLSETFGTRRVVDTPIAEAGIVGVAAGAAMMGLKPVVEMQFSDFIACCYNQIVHQVAQSRYRWGAGMGLVIRCPSGGHVHGGPFHSQNPESWFFSIPGLKIVTPATVEDAKGLIKSAIRDPDPVLYFEHKYLYRRIKGPPPPEDLLVPIGKGRVARRGEDATVITYGSTVHLAVHVAEQMAVDEEVSVEVVDLRSLKPLDRELILDSVRRTGRVLVLHEDRLTGGVGGEIAAIISEEAFEFLDAPVKRLGALDTPVPYSPPLEDRYQVSAERVRETLEALIAY